MWRSLIFRMRRGAAPMCARPQELNPTPKVIILTNYPHPENRKKCIERGADYFFFDKSTSSKKCCRY